MLHCAISRFFSTHSLKLCVFRSRVSGVRRHRRQQRAHEQRIKVSISNRTMLTKRRIIIFLRAKHHGIFSYFYMHFCLMFRSSHKTILRCVNIVIKIGKISKRKRWRRRRRHRRRQLWQRGARAACSRCKANREQQEMKTVKPKRNGE